MNNIELGQVLLRIARQAIGEELGVKISAVPAAALALPDMQQPGATFVTLTLDGELRGCIGTLQAHRPLIDDVRANALAAAFLDPRFMPLTREEFDLVRVEVSLLAPPTPMAFVSEADALAQLRPNIDGVILESGWHRATFLPQVWESLPAPQQFMAQLKRKAGLPADDWNADIQISRYEVQKWKEE